MPPQEPQRLGLNLQNSNIITQEDQDLPPLPAPTAHRHCSHFGVRVWFVEPLMTLPIGEEKMQKNVLDVTS